METLFRFVLRRPPVEQAPEFPSIQLAQNSNYQAELAGSLQSEDPRKVLKESSARFVATANYIKDPAQLKEAANLQKLGAAFDELEKQEQLAPADFANAVNNAIGSQPAAYANSQPFKEALSRIKDTIVAIKQLPEEHARPVERLSNLLRDMETVQKAVADAGFPDSPATLRKFRRRSLQLPTQADLQSILNDRERARKEEEARRKKLEEEKKNIQAKADLYQRLKKAVEELMTLDNQQLEQTPQNAQSAFLPPAEVRPLNVFVKEMQHKQSLGELELINIRNTKAIASAVQPQSSAVQEVAQSKRFISGIGAFQPVQALGAMFRFKAGTEQQLTANTKTLLEERKLSITAMPLDTVVLRLRTEMETLSEELDKLTETEVQRSFKRVGKAMVMISTPKASHWSKVSVAKPFEVSLPVERRVPLTKGKVAPAGIADLIVVKQQLKGYAAMDVAHIENVLKGEKKVRDHRLYRQTEETTFTETETTNTEEQELESTDRFEMSRETSATIKEDSSLKAGVNITASYGPFVEVSASVEGSMSRSKEEAVKTASKFSKDVTQRSSNKLTERILQRAQLKVTNEVEEKNNHTIDNVAGAGHIAGVYQWVEKVYEAQMFNYGLRLMYDFMVPEPAAFLIEQMQGAHADAVQLQKPPVFTLQPNQINEVNYHYWLHQYGATGIQPPPEEFITKTFNHNAGNGDDKTDYTHSGIIQIDEGYKAVQCAVGRVMNFWESNGVTDVVCGRRAHRFVDGESWVWTSSLDNETDSIPFGLKTWRISDLAVTVEIKCQRTDRAWKKWQLETHAKLMEAYQGKLSDYEAALAALEMQAGIAIEGKNPGLNLEIMKDELKKHCTTILTAQHFDLFDAIQGGSYGYPQIDLFENEAEGPYVRFFEQAFEWEHITWVTYPYFWGRKSEWADRITYEDTDPLFNQFLKAGYVRVTIPVRLGFEGAVDHFMTFGETWNGGPLPTISNPLYLPIADELAERLDRPGDEVPEGDPWEVRVPTTLVKLKADDQLPVWQKNEQGQWVPA